MGWDVCDKWEDIESNRTAIIDLTSGARNDISFGELKTCSNQLANLLVDKGIGPGERIGVFRSQSLWTAAAHIAVWKLGAISMPLFMLFGEDALISRLQNSGAKAVVTDVEGAVKLEALRAQLPDLQHIIVPENERLENQPEAFDVKQTMPDTPGVLIYTSGTTGPPKGALHGHRVLWGHLPGFEMFSGMFPQNGDVLWTPADWHSMMQARHQYIEEPANPCPVRRSPKYITILREHSREHFKTWQMPP